VNAAEQRDAQTERSARLFPAPAAARHARICARSAARSGRRRRSRRLHAAASQPAAAAARLACAAPRAFMTPLPKHAHKSARLQRCSAAEIGRI
jgi:hypothetical protein